nr:MAG TPA: hypothetical protein [Caudoviricetes sp.]
MTFEIVYGMFRTSYSLTTENTIKKSSYLKR